LLGVECDKKGCVLVDKNLNPKGHPEIFVLGDLAHSEQDGKQIAAVAQPAMQMGVYAAKRIGKLIQHPLDSYESVDGPGFRYFDKGDMATIGRHRAIARIAWPFKANWSGYPAFIMWCLVHIFFLMGFRNKTAVAWHWFCTYASLNDGARLITGPTDLPAPEARVKAV
jgi:NADH dehydrogenase